MANKDYTAKILQRMEEGTEEIYSRYEQLIRASEKSYDAKIGELENRYRNETRLASARAEVDLKNTLEQMADSGYTRSGETLQARAYANASRSAALAALATERAEGITLLESEKEKTSKELLAQAGKEANAQQTELERIQLEQTNWEREYEAKRMQEAEENRLAEEKLKLESQNQEKEEEKKSEAIVPEKSVYDYLDDIVKKHTTYNNKKGYKTVDRKGILQSLSTIIKDTKISYRYRYELYLYGKSLGYITD